MVDSLTLLVLEYQKGEHTLEVVRNRVWEEAFAHLRRYGRKGEDEVSDFLLLFHGKIPGILERFHPVGLPFRHFRWWGQGTSD